MENQSSGIASRCGIPSPRTHSLCAASDIARRAYPLLPHWPVGVINLVMEREPGTCDLYSEPDVCCQLTGPRGDIPMERHVREVIISFLSGCSAERPCRAVDLGANNGWFSSLMLGLGAHVISIEPQSDFARAIGESARLNCWAHRSTVLNKFACGAPCQYRTKLQPSTDHVRCPFADALACVRIKRVPGESGFVPCKKKGCTGMKETAWRFVTSQAAAGLPRVQKRREAIQAKLDAVRGMTIEQIFLGEHVVPFGHPRALGDMNAFAWNRTIVQRPVHYELVKMDGDGPEVTWLRNLHDLIVMGEISVGAIVFEGNGSIRPGVLKLFQALNYTLFRLDVNDERRYMTSRGWDAFSPNGTFGRLNRVRSLPRDALEEELFGIRAMRHVFRVRGHLNDSEWETILTPIRRAMPHFLLTQEHDLTEPSVGEAVSRGLKLASVEWRAGGNPSFRPRRDGMD